MRVSHLASRALLVGHTAALLLAPGASRAQEPSASPPSAILAAAPTPVDTPTVGDLSASIELFRDGRQLLAQGHVEAACAKFRASLALRRSPGTLLNVGNCLEQSGDLTDAVNAFEETLALARGEDDPRKSEAWSRAARDELERLSPRIPRLVVTAPSEADVRVELDGRPFLAFGVEQRINPGQHSLQATAPGKRRIERRFELTEHQQLVLDVSPLGPVAEAEPVAVGPAQPSQQQRPTESDAVNGESQLLPWSILGVGGAVLVAGAITGVVAANQTSDLSQECPNHVCEDGLSAPESAHRTAVTADVLMAVGLVGVAVGATWLLWPEDDTTPGISASCGADGCSASIRGRFF